MDTSTQQQQERDYRIRDTPNNAYLQQVRGRDYGPNENDQKEYNYNNLENNTHRWVTANYIPKDPNSEAEQQMKKKPLPHPKNKNDKYLKALRARKYSPPKTAEIEAVEGIRVVKVTRPDGEVEPQAEQGGGGGGEEAAAAEDPQRPYSSCMVSTQKWVAADFVPAFPHPQSSRPHSSVIGGTTSLRLTDKQGGGGGADPEADADPLLSLCLVTAWDPDPGLVQQLVVSGAADVLALNPAKGRPHLSQLALFGRLEAVRACLRTPRTLDFTAAKDRDGDILPHFFCYCKSTDEVAVDMLKALLMRLDHHPEEPLDWGLRDADGLDFISVAAEYQRLALFWPLVKRVPYYVALLEQISLAGGNRKIELPIAYEEDWQLLPPEDQELFAVEDFRSERTEQEEAVMVPDVLPGEGEEVQIAYEDEEEPHENFDDAAGDQSGEEEQ